MADQARGRAVVTGGAGFLGSHICERLLNDGWDVVCIDNFLTGTPANVEHLLSNPQFRMMRANVTDYVHVPGDVDVIYHFASPASPIDYLQLPIQTMKVGSIGTLHMLGHGQGQGRAVRARVDVGDLRRPGSASAAGVLLGQRQSRCTPNTPWPRPESGSGVRTATVGPLARMNAGFRLSSDCCPSV